MRRLCVQLLHKTPFAVLVCCSCMSTRVCDMEIAHAICFAPFTRVATGACCCPRAVHGRVVATLGWQHAAGQIELGKPSDQSGTDTNGVIRAIETPSAGVLVIDGDFTTVGNLTANYIAPQNALGFVPMGTGINGPAYAIKNGTFNSIFAGGTFTATGGGGAPFSRAARAARTPTRATLILTATGCFLTTTTFVPISQPTQADPALGTNRLPTRICCRTK